MKDGPGFYVEVNHADSMPTENGPFSSEEEDIVRQVAAKVVEDVITKAAKTASQQNSEEDIFELENGLPCFLQAVPSIQIDTVPSMPPSPSEEETSFPGSQVEVSDIESTTKTQDGASSKEEIVSEDIRNFANKYVQDILGMALSFIEKDLISDDVRTFSKQYVQEILVKALAYVEQDLITEEVRNFASSYVQDILIIALAFVQQDLLNQDLRNFAGDYVQDILSKAVTMVQKSLEEKSENIRQVASMIVEDVLKRAAETASEREIAETMVPVKEITEPVVPPPEIELLPNLPSIQIDTVASRASSPSEETETAIVKTAVDDSKRIEKEEEEAKAKLEREARAFAAIYLKDIITKAVGVAEQRLVTTPAQMGFEEAENFEKSTGPWYIRAREAFVGFLRVTCFCGSRRNDS